MTTHLFQSTILLFCGLFVVGTLLCLPLYRWSLRSFIRSSLWTKVVWWLPIFIVFELCLVGKEWACLIVSLLLLVQASREYGRQYTRATAVTWLYLASFCVFLAHLPLYFPILGSLAVSALLVVCFSSVLSDVCAFFFGSFLGKHHLPSWINPGKSWEGVLGQIVGAFVGFTLVRLALGIELSWWLALAIGLASAAGDIANSIAKRQLHIKDWGQTIPGHGGILDRLSSLSAALAVSFWIVRFIG